MEELSDFDALVLKQRIFQLYNDGEVQNDDLVTLNQRKRPREDKLISKIDLKLPKKSKLDCKWDFNGIIITSI